MSNQLVKKNPAEGYQNVFPKTWIDAIKDKESGVSLQEILQGFNMYFLSYNGSRALTRCKVPSILRKEGLWITYVLYDHTVVTEWYNSDQIDDNSWSMDSNWRVASNFLVGDVSVSADGYWVINGEKTEARAQGEQGVTPLLRVGANNKLQVSYNAGKAWKDISDYIVPKFRWNQGTDTSAGTIQISMDLGKTWTNLSNEITNNLRISRYIGINESLPTSGVAEGTIYMKGPYYDESDTSNTNPIYRMWVYAWKGNTLAWQDNGEFTVISAGVVQERGNSTTEVMSQDAVTKELTKLESKNSQLGQKALIPDIEILTGGYIEGTDGSFHAYTTDPSYYTDFIPLANDVLFFYTGRARYAVCMWAFYDEDKVFISSYGTNADADNTQVQSIPVNARYIRFSSIYTQMVIWVTSREKLYSLHLENKSSISEEANRAQNKENELQEEIDYVSAILDGFTYDKVGFYNVETGTYSDYSGAEGARAISNFLPISNDIDYIISGHSQYSAAIFVLYDADKNVLTTFPAASQNLTIENTPMRELMVIPSNAKFVRFSTFNTSLAYGCRPVILEKKWLGKKWVVVGDSLTEHNRRALKNYHDYISEDTGISVLNYGVGGTGYAKDKSANSAFFQRINSIPTDVQVITIFGSGNDIGFLPLGEITDNDTTTLCGCVNATIDAILARFPMTPFGIITPTPWFDSWTPESAPNNMSNYVDAIVEICKKKGIPYLNLFYCSNLHPEIPAIRAIEYKRDGTYVASSQGTPNAIQVTADLLGYIRNYGGLPNAQIGDWVLGTLDGVHPDEDGHKLFAPRIEAFLKTLLLN